MLGTKKQDGFSLIELTVVLAVVGILTIVAIPSFFNYLQMNNVAQNAQKLYYNLQYAKSEAIKKNTTVYVVFQTGSNWCYGMNDGATCTCSTAGSCGLGSVSASTTDFSTLSLTSITNNSFTFEGTHGATYLNGGFVTFTVSGGSDAVSIQISLAGDLLLCSSTVGGYQACP